MKKKRSKQKHKTKFRIASLKWLHTEWFGHREGEDRNVLELMANDIIASVDRFRMRNWEIQSSVDGGETWQTQQNLVIAW